MVERIRLANGVRILLEQIPSVRSVAVGYWVKAGSLYEEKENNGISHFIEHMLFKGTKNRTAREIAQAFDRLGGQVNAFTSKEYTCYYAKVLDTHLDQAMEILTDMYHHSLFDHGEMEKEKKVILEEISMVEDTPDDLIHDLIAQATFGDHPIGLNILGQVHTLESFTRKEIDAYMEERYRPENLVISIAGHFDRTVVDKWIQAFSGLNRMEGIKREIPLPRYTEGEIKRFKPELEQAHLTLSLPGLPFGHPDIYSLILLNTVLGGSMSSRLFQQIREEKGLAYNVYSYHSSYQETGFMVIYAGTRPDQLGEVEKIIQDTLENLMVKGVTHEELEGTKEQLKGNLMLSLESTNSRMSRNGKNELLLERHPTLDELIATIDAVTEERLLRLARELFQKPLAKVVILPGSSKETVEEIE
ncbi:M16 family metallopeptidase [Thermicanus aegyptius]|uniref:M16 family metallopeptidase n=1 Tax=Thermicanus aegyptius TaxID=94009 RepID=UPI000408E6BE|nr:pitrilysin family protein [Thermicanus aegyptius]